MKNNQPETTPQPKLQICAACNQTGKYGAQWLFYVGESSVPRVVHKPCGEMLLKSAPEGVRAKLVPSRQLRDGWREKRITKSFWDKAFADAKPLKSAVAEVAPAPLAPLETAQAA